MAFADILLPLPLPGTFTYSIPDDMEEMIALGSRVFVQFGKKKYYTGIVAGLHENPPADYEVKPIMMVLDSRPIIRRPQMKLWNWISEYYLCSPGEVYKAAIPTGLKIESETVVTLNPDFDASDVKLTERQAIILQALDHNGSLSLDKIQQETGLTNPGVVVNTLMECGAVEVDERRVEHYRPRQEVCVRLTIERGDNDALHEFFDKVNRARQQERALISWLDASGWMRRDAELQTVTKKDLMEASGASPAVIKAMCDKGIFEIYKREINRFGDDGQRAEMHPPTLSPAQSAAANSIVQSFRECGVTLLHGVTGSGKTEIYTSLICTVLESGSQVLYLVPEIALTTQLTDRLRKVFGNKLVVWHSKFTDNERVDIWRRLLDSHEPLVILGVRSSVFLPFAHLGLVIVDEEHEASYKQYDPAPRYNARDTAIVLASMHGAKTLLGSATPSVETYYKATNGKYGLVTLTERYGESQLPQVEIIDMRVERKRRTNKGILSSVLRQNTRLQLQQGMQAIMFQNRRGFAPMVVCKECGWTPKCLNCDVSPVYHKNTNELRCHYCGYTATLPNVCPACGLAGIEILGYGTERIAEEIHEEYPEFRVARMDLDTTRNKDAYQEIIEEFADHQTDILVGTQMVSKGLDFGSVSIVGVLNADTLLNFPDFRSGERAFNMLEQVAGRAGRRKEPGRVIIQTTDPANRILKYVKNHDYNGYYESELNERNHYKYPPFTRIINITVKHRESDVCDAVAVDYVKALRDVFGDRVLGPERPYAARVANKYIQQIMLKVEANASMKKVKALLRQIYEAKATDRRYRSAIFSYDVDPV